MKIGDIVYYFTKDLDIMCAEVFKIGKKYYYIEGQYLSNEHKKIDISTNKSINGFNPKQFFLSEEEIKNKRKSILRKDKIQSCLNRIHNERYNDTFNSDRVLELLENIIEEMRK